MSRSNHKDHIKKIVVQALVVSVVLGAIAGGIAGAGISIFFLDSSTNPVIQQVPARAGRSGDVNILKELEFEVENQTIKVVEKVTPAVVSIIATQELALLPRSTFFDDFFFGFPFEMPSPQEPQIKRQQVSSGSGFIVRDDGIVITNRHVVSNTAAEYSVVLSSGETYELEVLDRDPVQDLAVARIIVPEGEKKTFSTVTLGSSDTVRLGQTVIAIGNTLGEFRNTVTRGIVSGINRTITAGTYGGDSELIEGAIQTDAAISSGNSGGPLLNIQGEVVGVNTAVSSRGENIGFALPVDQVKLIIDSIEEYGKIVRPFLGVRYIILNKDIAKNNNMEIDHGALVMRGETRADLAVIPGSPADIAGIKENDVILKVNGKEITEGQSLQALLSRHKVGDKIALRVYRAGKEFDVDIQLEDRGDFDK